MKSVTIEHDVCRSTDVQLGAQFHDDLLRTPEFGCTPITVDDRPLIRIAMAFGVTGGQITAEDVSAFFGRSVELATTPLGPPARHQEAW